MNTKTAIIDLGTNTFHLLIAEGSKAIYKDEITVRLGKGGISKGILLEEAMQRGLDTLAHYKSIINEYKADNIYAFGTSALRNASNANEFIDKVRKKLEISIEVIDGKREAEYIYQGIVATGLLDSTPSLIMDIGGGSVEFIMGTNNDIIWRKSYEIGAQRLLDKFVHSDPISNEHQTLLKNYLDEELNDLKNQIKLHKPDQLIGASGTFHTLTHMLLGKKSETPVKIKNKKLHPLFNRVLLSIHSERLKMNGIPKGREDMIVPASILVDFILNEGNFEGFSLSPYSLKEGVLWSLNNSQ